ncbi:biotin--[acetyl-CoA-carboxylase] ligase [Thiocapsa imhoffii]|uniref:biotin--[biotin carboxyl-carrier protein] ligase n=2 Tax=Thiocapsa imhoffii TaxID=382777 RepID=A0A9X1B7M2_9GAMM|nr:biotin--[acetyl-CoA-carboxylase] ligase [Thiocapsa imhoffii]
MADGEPHDPRALAQTLNVTITALEQALKGLGSQLGLQLIAVPGGGYRLAHPIELLDAGHIMRCLSPRCATAIPRLEIHDQLDSTNRYLMRSQSHGALSRTVCLAEYQRAGRGRLGRRWISPYGANLYLSLLWHHQLPAAALSGVSLVAGAVVADRLSRAGVTEMALKWPNDLLWRRRKLGGILIETTTGTGAAPAVVLGVGLNVQMDPSLGAEIDQPWVDLCEALGVGRVARNLLAAQLIEALVEGLERFERDGLAPFIELWNAFDCFHGETAVLSQGGQVTEGVLNGLAPSGALRLRTADGERLYHAGEVSLRTRGENAS